MNTENKRITNKDLAVFFIEKSGDKGIINEMFDFFGFDCIMRCNIDPDTLDRKIRDFENDSVKSADKLEEIISLIRNSKGACATEERELVEKTKEYITEHIFEDMTIEEVALRLNVSYYYICHFFKKHMGESLISFRNRRRIEAAVKMLYATDKKIADIATDCGFNNTSYFTETFTKYTSFSPTVLKQKLKDICIHSFYSLDDILLALKLGSVSFLQDEPKESSVTADTTIVLSPDERFGFLHEAAIIEFGGKLYASWYNCHKHELRGYTPICERRSADGGKSWTELKIIADDKSEKILYCPPVYGICDGRLYMLLNQMVAPDHIHSLDLYVLNEETDCFEFLWSKPIPFKLNTNVVALPNGKLMLPGRIGELDGFPNTPAVLISDSGKIDAEWRLVKIAENGDLPDGKKLVHPEISVILCNGILYMFNRNDQRRVPIVYTSEDMGESWSEALSHDIPYVSSKIYSGTLSNGMNYLIANTDRFDRSKLAVYFSKPHSMEFNKYCILFDTNNTTFEGASACHYPCAYEADGKLYIIATLSYEWETRGAVLFTVDINDI